MWFNVLDTRLKQTAANALTVRGAVFVLGKLSLVAAIGFAYYTGVTLAEAEKMELASLDLGTAAELNTERGQIARDEYEVIRTRNLFGKVKQTESKPQAAPVTTLKLRLVGTNVSDKQGNSLAIVEDTAKKEQDVFGLNDEIFNQAKLVEIFPDSVRLSYNGKIETLMLEDGEITPGPRGTTQPTAGQTDFSIDEGELNDALANLPQLLSQARAVPYFKNGESIGMRLFAIRAGSLYQKLGLKNGDVIKMVNDHSLSDPSQALKIFDQLKSERSITVKLERAGEEMSLNYQIR